MPVGYAQMSYALAPGRQNVDLVFFGRMFAEARGRRAVSATRRARDAPQSLDGGEHNIPFEYDTPYLTKPWRHSRTVAVGVGRAGEAATRSAAMERLIADTAAGRIGGPTTQPQHIDIDENGVAHVVP